MYKKTHKPSKKLDNESSMKNNVIAFNENGSVAQMNAADADRIDYLKIAINKGDYTINPLRVAEKFIQFENQLSA
jgi:anti-sigma28 factor (negative regulator of flagellin synthesis)